MSHYALINSVFDNVTLGIIQFYLHSPHQLPIGGSTGLSTLTQYTFIPSLY